MTTFPSKITFLSDCTEIQLQKINTVKKGGEPTAIYIYTKAEVLINRELVLGLKQISKLLDDKLIEVE